VDVSHNIEPRRDTPLLLWKINKYALDIMAFVIQHAKCTHRIMLSYVAFPSLQYFSTLSDKRHEFRKSYCLLFFPV